MTEGARSQWKAACGRLIKVVGLGFLLFVAYVGLRSRNSLEPFDRAILFGDVQAMENLLKADPTLARKPMGFGREMPLSMALNCQGAKEKIELLLAYGADINARSGAFKLTPLQHAAWSANVVAVKTLLAHNPDVNAVEGESPGRRALNYAVTADNKAIIEMLLAHGADIAHGYSVLYDAESHPELFDYLLAKGADPNAQNSSQDTPLIRAIYIGDTNRIATILRYHPNLAVKNSGDRTALAIAVDGCQSNVVSLLLGHIHQTRTNGLGWVAAEGRVDTLRRMLETNRESALVQDEFGLAPLHWAAEAGQESAVELLLSYGANSAATDSRGLQPMDWAVINGHLPIVKMLIARGGTGSKPSADALIFAIRLNQPEVAALLVGNGADSNARQRYSNGPTPLHEAARAGNFETVRLLLENGADVNAREMNNSTPLQFAVIGNSKEIVSLLIARGAFIPAEKPGYLSLFHDWALGAGDPGIADILQTHGADVNARLSDGQTPLHLAAHQGEKRAVEWLLSHGAEINAKDKRGDTPLALLKPRRGPGQRTEIADLLRSHGAQ